MKITIKGKAKKIAALASALKEQHESNDVVLVRKPYSDEYDGVLVRKPYSDEYTVISLPRKDSKHP